MSSYDDNTVDGMSALELTTVVEILQNRQLQSLVSGFDTSER